MVTGRRSLRASGALATISEALESAGVRVAVFDQVEPEPKLDFVRAGIEALRTEGCELVVAVGGGSALDVGKAIGGLAHAPGAVEDYYAGREVLGPGVPVIAIPTTAGTGAEVTPNSVLSDPASGEKKSMRGSGLMPRVALVDPQLTAGMGPRETAYTGIDAFTQALESFISTGANAYSDPLALRAIELTGTHLRAAVADGSSAEAREAMSLGSLLAGLALASARLGLVHGMAHPIGARYSIPHGLACGILLPHVLRFNLPSAETKLALAARALGIAEAHSAEELVGWVAQLCEDVGVAPRLREFGATEADVDGLVPPSVSAGSSKFNPRPVDAAAVREVLAAAI